MDFLKIRKKARERAAAREAAGERARSTPASGPAEPREPRPPPADPVVTPADVLEGELAARLQGVSPEQAAAPGIEPRTPAETAAPPLPAGPPGAWPPPAVAQAPPGEPWTAPPASAPRATSGGPADPLEGFFYREDEEGPEVPPIGGSPDAPGEDEDPDTALREEYLTFLLGEEEYAVAVERVREVMKSPPITEVPRAPSHVLGVITVRGEVVAVLDPRRRLGLPAGAPAGDGRVVIVDAGEGSCGLLVDRVASVVRLRAGTIEPCPQGFGGAHADCLAGIGREESRIFTVLDLGALLRRAPDRPRGERRAGP